MERAMARGGSYHKRIPGPNGRYTYVYSDAEYRQRPDAHVDGREAAAGFVHHHVQRVLEKNGESGCHITEFSDLVQKHGHRAVARALRAHKVDFDGTHVRVKATQA